MTEVVYSPVNDIVDELPIRVLDNGEVRCFDVACANAVSENGETITIRKDGSVDHHRGDDWLVATTKTDGELDEYTVIHASITENENGDSIVLVTDRSRAIPYVGPREFRFAVDENYRLSGEIQTGFPSAHERDENHQPILVERQVFCAEQAFDEKQYRKVGAACLNTQPN